jgi:hypothetical protein
MEETSFSGAELAARARVGPELIGRLVELGILRPMDGQRPFGLGDVRRVRLAAACARAGLSLEGIGEAIAGGRLSLALVQRVHEASGLGGRSPRTRSTRSTGTCWEPPGWGGRWGWTTGC